MQVPMVARGLGGPRLGCPLLTTASTLLASVIGCSRYEMREGTLRGEKWVCHTIIIHHVNLGRRDGYE
jgi:hypothetical protein